MFNPHDIIDEDSPDADPKMVSWMTFMILARKAISDIPFCSSTGKRQSWDP
jgi:hypothetical protein